MFKRFLLFFKNCLNCFKLIYPTFFLIPFQKTHEELKTIVGLLSRLKYELQTDKPLTTLEEGSDCTDDCEVWNNFITILPGERNSYFKACWLYAECYLYRKIYSFFKISRTLKTYDYFAKQKERGLEISFKPIEAVAMLHRKMNKTEQNFGKLFKVNLYLNY